MIVHKDIDRLPVFRKAVVTIGTFDGVHLGHRQIISQLKTEAARIGGETVIITFHPHPRKIVYHDTKKVELINTIQERIELLDALGIDHLVIVPFTEQFSSLTPTEYIEKFLCASFSPAVVIIGYDHKFGKGREGDYKLLEQYSGNGFFVLKEIPQHLLKDITVSSTGIRTALKEGNIQRANELLGYAFFFEGTVIKGNQLGRTIGFPTANISIDNDEKIIPGNGVYAVEVTPTGTDKRQFKGMMNIGVRPTIGGGQRHIEVNIFDFDEDIYGQKLKVTVRAFLRAEKKFDGIEQLKEQLKKDQQASISYFNNQFLH